jgi:hypothetical protein
MSVGLLVDQDSASSSRLLADVNALEATDPAGRESAFERLEAAIGRDFADRLVAALSNERGQPVRD